MAATPVLSTGRAQIVCVGITHRTAPVEYREKFGSDIAARCGLLAPDFSPRATPALDTAIGEIACLATCNRVEFYAVLTSAGEPEVAPVLELLSAASGLAPGDIMDHAFVLRGREAIEHLCRVASGLDSLVLGEPQILGQVSDALETADVYRSAGPALHRVFRRAIRAGRRTRNETAIGTNPASASSVAVSLARSVVGSLRDRRVLVVGLGEMGAIAVKALRSRQVREIAVANRTRERADEVAVRWGCRTFAMDDLVGALAWADVVISTTRCPHVVVPASTVREAVRGRGKRPLVFVDVAVPRDVDPAVRELPYVFLFDADDLNGRLDEGIAAREREIPRAEHIIEQELSYIEKDLRELEVEPIIEELRRRAEQIRRREFENVLELMGDADPSTKEHLHLLSRSIVDHLLREPTVRLKQIVQQEEWREHSSAIKELFGL
jgi:glutamyl-tRNA reductase